MLDGLPLLSPGKTIPSRQTPLLSVLLSRHPQDVLALVLANDARRLPLPTLSILLPLCSPSQDALALVVAKDALEANESQQIAAADRKEHS